MARPSLKFLNSTIVLPPRTWVYQVASLPAPLPIRIPFALRERGKCGKTDIQKALLVMSDFLDDLLTDNLSLNIRFADILNGRFSSKPMVPYFIFVSARWVADRCFCRVLYLNFRGWRIICTYNFKSGRFPKVGFKNPIGVDRRHNKIRRL